MSIVRTPDEDTRIEQLLRTPEALELQLLRCARQGHEFSRHRLGFEQPVTVCRWCQTERP